ncbi:MAG: EAL domain-containing protein [bacterium]|nr:EAL domain-containing protein [bacterium]
MKIIRKSFFPDNNIFSFLPGGFRFRETDWYEKTVGNYNKYRFSILASIYAGGIVVSSASLLLTLHVRGSASLIDYLIPVLLSVLFGFFLLFKRHLAVMIRISLFLFVAFIIVTSLLYGGNNMFIIIFFIFPILAHKLIGSQLGYYWSLAFLGISLGLTVLSKTGVVAGFPGDVPTPILVMGYIAGAVITMLTYYGQQQHERYIRNTVKKLVYDDVTGLPERDAIIYSMDTGVNYLVAIIKLENFSDYVSLFGYEFSDDILRFVVKHLKEVEKEFGFRSFRLKGYEFGILMPLWDSIPSNGTIKSYLRKIWQRLKEKTIQYDNTEIRLIYRIGGAIATVENREHILSKADIALKMGARSHRPVTVFDCNEIDRKKNNERNSALHSVLQFTILIENQENNWFKSVYQPIIDVNTKSVKWYEALLRIRNREGEYVSPCQFLGVAQSTGMDSVISEFMLKEACAALEHIDQDISINLTLNNLLSKSFLKLVVDSYTKVKNKKGAKTGTLIFEILERDELVDIDSCLTFIDTVRNIGCKIAIDDFGSGHSNFENLLHLPIDIVKIDGSLVKRVLDDSQARSMLEGIASLFSKLNKPMVAEFVDCDELFTLLKAINIDYAQGYYFGEPGGEYF